MQLVQNDPARATLYRMVQVVNGPVIKADSSSAGKEIQVTSLQFEYTLQNDGTWARPAYSSGVEVYGPFLKKDRTHSANLTNFPLYSGRKAELAWMDKLADRLCPSGTVGLRPVPGEWEVDVDDLEA
jgi:hypothetical protein